MGIVVWLLSGAVIAGIYARSRRFAFSAGRSACVLGGMAGGFLGGGTLTAAMGASQSGRYAPATAAAVAGALVVIAAIGWAGGTEHAPPSSADGRNRSAR